MQRANSASPQAATTDDARYTPYFLSSLSSGTIALVAFLFLLHPFPASTGIVFTAFDLADGFQRSAALNKTFAAVSYVVFLLAAATNCWLNFQALRHLINATRSAGLAKVAAPGQASSLHVVPLALSLNILVISVISRTAFPVPEGAIQALIPLGLLLVAICTAATMLLLANSLYRRLRTGRDSTSPPNNLHLASYALSLQALGVLACGRPCSAPAVSSAAMPIAHAIAVIAVLVSTVAIAQSITSIARYGVTLHNSGTFWLIVPVLTTQTIVFTAGKHPGGVLSGAASQIYSADNFVLHFWLLGTLVVQGVLFILCVILASLHHLHRGQFDGTDEPDSGAFLISLPGVNFALMIAYVLQTSLVPFQNPSFGTPTYLALSLLAFVAVAASIASDVTLHPLVHTSRATRVSPGDLPATNSGG